MIINKDQTIAEVQKNFQEKFPYLKIEFYTIEHAPGEASPVNQQISASKRIGAITKKAIESELSINGHQKVKTLEEHLKTHFGLNAQVFRRSGTIWLQTTTTDEWTLSDQNAKGQLSVERI